jgi:hypothetical protein
MQDYFFWKMLFSKKKLMQEKKNLRGNIFTLTNNFLIGQIS